MATYKNFTYNLAGDPGPWGVVENQLDKDLIDTMVLDCVSATKDTTNGHRHYRVYDSSGNEAAKGVSGDFVVNDDLNLLSDLSVLNFGADKDVNLTHVHNTGLLLNSSRQLQFGDSGTHISQGTNGHLDHTADISIDFNIGATEYWKINASGAWETQRDIGGSAFQMGDYYAAGDDKSEYLYRTYSFSEGSIASPVDFEQADAGRILYKDQFKVYKSSYDTVGEAQTILESGLCEQSVGWLWRTARTGGSLTDVFKIAYTGVRVTGDFYIINDGESCLKIWNTTEEDTGGGRKGTIQWRGEQSGGETSLLAKLEASHDGSSDDQKGQLKFYTNDGSDGDSPTERLTINSDGDLTLSTGNLIFSSGGISTSLNLYHSDDFSISAYKTSGASAYTGMALKVHDGDYTGLYIGNTGNCTLGGTTTKNEGSFALKYIGDPSGGLSGYGRLYAKSDNKLYYKDGSGSIHEIAYV